MIEIYGYSIMTVPIIASLVYGVIEFFKSFVFPESETYKKYIPLISAMIGGILGVLAFFVCPQIMPATTWYYCVVIGCASGLSAVGVHQIKKQTGKNGGEKGGT